MRQIFATAAILAIAAGPAFAQEIPEGQSCGGLFCDLGIVGHKTPPAPAAAPAAPQATRTETVPAAAAAAAAVVTEPRKRIVRRKRAVPETRTAAVKPAEPPLAKPALVAVPAPVAVPAAPVAAKPLVAAKPPAAPPPSNDEPVIFVSPASQPPPLKDMFRPIYR